MADLRPIPTVEHAEGMLAALKRGHSCTEACTGTTVLGDGKVLQLRCPWEQIDLGTPTDRRIVASVYASEARAAMGAVG
jgi:hypothetical protein